MKNLAPLWLLPFLLAILALQTAGWIQVEPALRAGSARAERGHPLKPAAGR
jgi:hypothetical protein